MLPFILSSSPSNEAMKLIRLRRTFATVAAEMGIDVYRIGATLNHSKQGVTAGYIQTTVTMLKETLEAIEIAILKPYATPDELHHTQ